MVLVIGAILGAGGVYGYGHLPSSGGTSQPGLFNIWVDTNGGNCGFSATPIAYTDSGSCSNLTTAVARAVTAGDSGYTIGVACGTYPSQTIAPNSTLAGFSQNVVIDAASSALNCAKFHSSTSVSAVQINSSNVTVKHLQGDDSTTCTQTGYSYAADGSYIEPLCDSITVGTGGCTLADVSGDVVDSVDFAYYVTTSSQTTVQNSDFGPVFDSHSLVHSKATSSSSACPTRPSVTWTNNVVHDAYNTDEFLNGCPNNPLGTGCIPPNGQHVGCGPTFNDSNNSVVDRSLFYNCQDTVMLIKQGVTSENDNLTIKNSFFGMPTGGSCPAGCKLDINNQVNSTTWLDQSNLHFYNNTFNGASIDLLGHSGTLCTGCEFKGNLFDGISGTFGAPWAVDHNWTSLSSFGCTGTCSSNTTSFNLSGSLQADGFHLVNGSPLIGALPSGLSWAQSFDIDGDPRGSTPSPGADQGTASSGSGTGASQAVCSGTCTAGTATVSPSGTFSTSNCPAAPSSPGVGGTTTATAVWLGNINNGSALECRLYGVYIPTNLVHDGTATGQPPGILVGSGGGTCGAAEIQQGMLDGNWDVEAVNSRLIIIQLYKPRTSPSCGRSTWYHPQIDVPSSGSNSPSEEPYIAAVIADATVRFHLDPARLYIGGPSNMGAVAWDMLCDQRINTQFRGYFPVSSTMLAPDVSGAPGTVQCGSATPATNNNFFVDMVIGANDNAEYPQALVGGRWAVGFDGTRAYMASHLGCGASATSANFGTPTAANTHFTYHNCGYGTPQDDLRADKITGGGHGYNGLVFDSSLAPATNGYTAATGADGIWAYFAATVTP